MKLARPEQLLCALYGITLGYFAQAFWSLEPKTAQLMRIIWWGWALVCLIKAFRARPAPEVRGALLWTLARLPVWTALLLIVGWMHGYGYLTSAMLSLWGAIAGGIIEVGLIAGCAWVAWRHASSRPKALALGATLLFLGSMQFVVHAIWMWAPPSLAPCQRVLGREGVERLSPPHWPVELSQPYALLHVPEEQKVFGAFKMAGQGALPWWDDPMANRIWAMDLNDRSKVAEVRLADAEFPLGLAYSKERRELLTVRQGPGVHSLVALGIEGFPHLTRQRSVAVDYAPHRCFSQPEAGRYGVLGQHGYLSVVDQADLSLVRGVDLGEGSGAAGVALQVWHAPGTQKAYVSALLRPVLEVDMVTGDVRTGEQRLGGGYLSGSNATGELYLTDHLLNRVDIVSMSDLSVTRSLQLDYTPRPVRVDPARDLLIVGGWFDGTVHFYRLSTLAPLGIDVLVGSYLRDMDYDAKEGRVFAASKCGVYQLDVDALVRAEGG